MFFIQSRRIEWADFAVGIKVVRHVCKFVWQFTGGEYLEDLDEDGRIILK